LTLIFMMGQGAYRILFALQGQPWLHLWYSATIHNSDHEWCKTKNTLTLRWRSF
jgi:hypothetical protein